LSDYTNVEMNCSRELRDAWSSVDCNPCLLYVDCGCTVKSQGKTIITNQCEEPPSLMAILYGVNLAVLQTFYNITDMGIMGLDRSVAGLQGSTAGDFGDGLSREVFVGPNVVLGALHRRGKSRRRLHRRTTKSHAHQQQKKTTGVEQEILVTHSAATSSEPDTRTPSLSYEGFTPIDVAMSYTNELADLLDLAFGH